MTAVLDPGADHPPVAGNGVEARASVLDRPGHHDYVTVRLLAAGLARIRRVWEQLHGAGGAIRHAEADLLPTPWRMGFARLWWTCHDAGVSPPESDLELMQWCRIPFDEWTVRLDLSPADMQESLLHGDDLSPLAEQAAALEVDDVEAELIENRVYAELVLTAQANGRDDEQRQENYVYLRRFLIDRPVISDHDHRRLRQRLREEGANGQPYVTALLNAAYEARPALGPTVDLIECGACRNPLADRGDSCGTPGCESTPTTRELPVLGAYFVQHRGVRRFVHDPGLVEARLHDRILPLTQQGVVDYEPWPCFDAYDGRVSFRDPAAPPDTPPVEVWGFDAKDQASSRLLAINFAWNADPPCDRRYLVLPRHRATPTYVHELTTELEGRVSGIVIVDEDEFIARVARRADRLRRG